MLAALAKLLKETVVALGKFPIWMYFNLNAVADSTIRLLQMEYVRRERARQGFVRPSLTQHKVRTRLRARILQSCALCAQRPPSGTTIEGCSLELAPSD